MFNVLRSYPAPDSLTRSVSYSEQDVLDELKKIFHDKCYICEAKNPLSINVEHFVPHEGDLSLKFKWENLFYACGRCNNIKLAIYNDILDCTDESVDVRSAIKLLPPRALEGPVLIQPQIENDNKCSNTAQLLEKVYNSEHTPNKSITGAYLRTRLESFQN